MKKALITGILGQDGFFLTELLLSKGYEVFGFARPKNEAPVFIPQHVRLTLGNISNATDIEDAISNIMPDEIYHLASQSSPGSSWTNVQETLEANGTGATYLFEAVRKKCPTAKVYHASSSEMFGRAELSPQNEETPFHPANPYAAAKVYAHHMARIYRESYGLFIANGILFNHESERRPLHFVTQKVAYGAACAALQITDSPDLNERGLPIVRNGKLALGNLEIARDWGYAGDFVQAMWLMLQQEKPDDFVIGTGHLHTLRELCELAYRSVNKNWQNYVMSDPALVRPLEPSQTMANASKAQQILGWRPSVSLNEMIKKMVQTQIKRLATHLQMAI